ncbi:MAG: thymidine kinase [Chlamydiales bacterium]|nr:thymidine kinase [Chlamydiales bacterium]
MAKLYFRFGAVGSAKTLNLLAVAHNYRQQRKHILLIKPAMDDRFGKNNIKSRAGLETEADILVDEKTNLLLFKFEDIDCLLVDEAQFLSRNVIDQLRKISLEKSIPVICYGLRTDFRTNLFEGSRRLMEIADSIEEVKSTCHYCNRKAVMNLKHVNGKPTCEGASIQLGCEETYFPACCKCYFDQVNRTADKEVSSLVATYSQIG